MQSVCDWLEENSLRHETSEDFAGLRLRLVHFMYRREQKGQACLLCLKEYKIHDLYYQTSCCGNLLHPRCVEELLKKTEMRGACPGCREPLNPNEPVWKPVEEDDDE